MAMEPPEHEDPEADTSNAGTSARATVDAKSARDDERHNEKATSGRVALHLNDGTRVEYAGSSRHETRSRTIRQGSLLITLSVVGIAVFALASDIFGPRRTTDPFVDDTRSVHAGVSAAAAEASSEPLLQHAAIAPMAEPPEPRQRKKTVRASAKHTAPPPEKAGDCCRICRSGQACGDACIDRKAHCSEPPGCACQGAPTTKSH